MTVSIQQLAADCALQLFRAYGVPLTPRSDPKSAPRPEALTREATLVGAMTELRPVAPRATGRGKLVLVTTFALVEASRPSPREVADPSAPPSSSPGDWLFVRDWVRELTNQLAGRVMNQLAAGGAHVTFAPPVTLTAEAIARELGVTAGVRVRLGAADQRTVDVVVVLPPESQMRAGGPAVTNVAREGSVVLFDGDKGE